MEAGDSGTRQSGTPAASCNNNNNNNNTINNNLNPFERRDQPPHRERIDTPYREGPPQQPPSATMATATLISPSAPYHQHHPSFNPGYPHSSPATSIPSMISPIEPRRPADETDSSQTHRQSLPSISEVISATKPGAFPPPPPITQSQTLPPPFASSGPPRSPFEQLGADKNSSPRTLHPPSTGYSRPDTLPAISDPSRPLLTNRPAPPPLNTFSGQHHSPPPPLRHDQHDAEQRQGQLQPLSAGHREQTQQQQLPGLYAETGRLPPGQLPLSGYPVSPRHNGPTLPSPYDAQRPPMYSEESPEYTHHRLEYKAALDKHFEQWGYSDSLQMIANSCRTGFNFAEGYLAAAREQGSGSQPIPSRMPTENEVSGLISNLVLSLKKLEEIRDLVQHNRIVSERASREHGRKEEDDVSMYGDGMKPAYNLNEVKKRRGRAAPPGRCHSCNRIDTPEWRRGPDGARTLCNACGLHYAKLERKRQMDQRSLRPKPSEHDRN